MNLVGKFVPCSHQTRFSRCADNGFLEECISAGGEKTTESRKCKTAAVGCVVSRDVGAGGGEKETSAVTGEDIDIARKRRIGATDLIPRVPDYSGPTATLEGWHRQLFGRGKFHTNLCVLFWSLNLLFIASIMHVILPQGGTRCTPHSNYVNTSA